MQYSTGIRYLAVVAGIFLTACNPFNEGEPSSISRVAPDRCAEILNGGVYLKDKNTIEFLFCRNPEGGGSRFEISTFHCFQTVVLSVECGM